MYKNVDSYKAYSVNPNFSYHRVESMRRDIIFYSKAATDFNNRDNQDNMPVSILIQKVIEAFKSFKQEEYKSNVEYTNKDLKLIFQDSSFGNYFYNVLLDF